MDLILHDLRRQSPQYKGLRIDSYIRQGSSRDGLKVWKADEFDSMLEFHIEGLEKRVERMYIASPLVSGKNIPGFCYLQITGTTPENLRKSCPELFEEGVFQSKAGQIFISSKRLYERVFYSMVDKAIHNLTIEDASTIFRNAETFRLTQNWNPPAINVTIELKFSGKPAKVIDLDLVPAFCLSLDKTTRYKDCLLNCPIHAVCKWIDGEDFNQDLIWSAKSTGYEIHILDVARDDQRTLFIMTALRIVKTYFVKTTQIAKAGSFLPPQIVTVLKSYHLKQIAFYMIYYICHKYKHFKLYSAEKALSYFIAFLDKALEAKRLPHFFFTSSAARDMLPGFPEQSRTQQRYNLFRKIPSEALAKAKQSLSDNLILNVAFSGGGGGRDDELTSAIQDFGNAILGDDDYF
ncbi:uncharacterized protein LOC127846018 [Dreissena polymorpha]|nr:uncharacterized protein LOC127846018 [Dreissena polymorpha]